MADESRSVMEPGREVPVRAAYDVIVAGAGLGGVSAAMAAARAGAKTLLIERNGVLGGTATAGMVCSIFNCYYTAGHCLGVTGNAVTVADALAAATGFGQRWHQHQGHVIYDVEEAKRVLVDLVEQAGAQILLDTVVSAPVMAGDLLRGLIVENKSGREALLAKVVVDATGDADVAALTGAPVGARQTGVHSFCFRLGQVDVDQFVDYFVAQPDEYPEHMDVDWTFAEVLAQYRDTGTFLFPHGGGMQMSIFKAAREAGELPERIGVHDTLDACQMHALRDRGTVHLITGFSHFDGLDGELISRSINDGRRMAFAVAEVFRRRVPGFARSYVVGTADDLGVRISRWITGDVVFTAAMKTQPTRCTDAIGRGVVEHDLVKNPRPRAWGAQTFAGDTFDIPYGCLLPRRVEGLLMGAGRSVSAEHPWLLRTMVQTMVVGQGAGVAAAVAARSGVVPRQVAVGEVQAELRRQGVVLNATPG